LGKSLDRLTEGIHRQQRCGDIDQAGRWMDIVE
jgi:hypothetical protein